MHIVEHNENGEVLVNMNVYSFKPHLSFLHTEGFNYKNDNVTFHVNCVGDISSETNFKSHTSRSDYYLIYVSEGVYNLATMLGSFSIKKNEFVIFSPDQTFYNHHIDHQYLHYHFLHFTGYGVSELLKSLELSTDKIYKSNKTSTAIVDLFNKVADEFRLYDTFYQTAATARVYLLLTRLSRSTSNPFQRQKLRSSLLYINENLSSDLYVETLAKIENMSVQHYRQVFKEYTGLSPNEYIISERLALAREMLSHTTYSVFKISQQCGYPDSLYFSRVFKHRLGVSPLAYRKANSQISV